MINNTSLPFVPAGSRLDDSAAAYFRSACLPECAAALTADYDMVIIDTPPVMSAAETSDIAAQADGVVLVVSAGTPLARPPRCPPAPLDLAHPDPRLHLQPRQGLHRRLRLRLRLRPRQDLAGAANRTARPVPPPSGWGDRSGATQGRKHDSPRPSNSSPSGGGGSAARR